MIAEIGSAKVRSGGTTDPFERFFRGEFAAVARTAGLVVRDWGVGEEVAQEAFARLYGRWAQMSSELHARNFVYRVALNLARSHRRRSLRPFVGAVPTITSPDPATGAVDHLVIMEALASLSPRQRACLIMVDFAGHSAASTARILRTRESTVRVHLMRARRALREALDDPEEPR
jgi:RNA polymerase sigma factor (sigma-70 family)